MSDEDKKEIEDIIKRVDSKKSDLDDILNSKNISLDDLFLKLFNAIIQEYNYLNDIIISKNEKNDFSKQDKKFLYDAINLFININNAQISKEIIETTITKYYLYIIMKTLINVNKNNILADNILEFNQYLISLLSNILINNPGILLDNLLFYKDSILLKFLVSLSQNRKGREFINDIEMYILMYFQENDKYIFYIESMNDVVNCISFQLNEKNFASVIEEIQNILYIYKSHIKIINESMKNLLIRIFYINETKLINEENKDNNFNEIITNFLRYCLNRIVFTFSSSISPGNNIEINPKVKTSFHYNVDFMNFLFEIYEALINNNLKNSYTNFLMELFLGLDNLGSGAKRYHWIIKHTNYPEIVLESIIKLKETNLLSCYMSKIIFLSMPNDKEYYKPYYDINFFFSKLGEIFDEKNLEISKKFFNIIASQIINLININDKMIELIYSKCDIFNESLLIFNSNTFSKEIKDLLLEFLEKIINIIYISIHKNLHHLY